MSYKDGPVFKKMLVNFGMKQDSNTNRFESFHAKKLNSEFTLCSPKHFYFYGDIKQYSNRETSVKLRSMNKKKLTRKQQEKSEYINQCMPDYHDGTITRVKFVNKVGLKFKD